MNLRIKFACETLQAIERAVEGPDFWQQVGPEHTRERIAQVVAIYCSYSQTADLEAIEKAIYEGNPL